MKLELKTAIEKYEQEKAVHDKDLDRLNAAKKDFVISQEEANNAALQGCTINNIVGYCFSRLDIGI